MVIQHAKSVGRFFQHLTSHGDRIAELFEVQRRNPFGRGQGHDLIIVLLPVLFAWLAGFRGPRLFFGGSWHTLATQSATSNSEHSFYLAFIVALPGLACVWFLRKEIERAEAASSS